METLETLALAEFEAWKTTFETTHQVSLSFNVDFPPVVGMLMQQTGIVSVAAPAIRLTATPLPDKSPIQLDGFFPEAAPKEELGT